MSNAVGSGRLGGRGSCASSRRPECRRRAGPGRIGTEYSPFVSWDRGVHSGYTEVPFRLFCPMGFRRSFSGSKSCVFRRDIGLQEKRHQNDGWYGPGPEYEVICLDDTRGFRTRKSTGVRRRGGRETDLGRGRTRCYMYGRGNRSD